MPRRPDTGVREIPEPRFGGLDLGERIGGRVSGGALAARNIEFVGENGVTLRRGSIRVANLTLTVGDHGIDLFGALLSNELHMVFGTREEIGWWTVADGATKQVSGAVAEARWWDFVRVGLPGVGQVYIACQPDSDTEAPPSLKLLQTTGLTAPGASLNGGAVGGNMGRASVVGVWEEDSRLLLGGFPRASGANGPNGMTADGDMVIVANPGNPQAFDTDSFFRVGVGDGERLTGFVNFRGQTMVFKQTRMWMLTGISAQTTGDAVFHRRMVDLAGAGEVLGPGAIAAASDGVYFATRRGVYRTTGSGPVVSISGDVARVFDLSDVLALNPNAVRLDVAGDLLLLSYQTSTVGTREQLVYDLGRKEWVHWSLNAAAFMLVDERLFFLDRGHEIITPVKPTLWELQAGRTGDYANGTTDEKSPATTAWTWQSQWNDFGQPAPKYVFAHRVSLGERMGTTFTLSVYSDQSNVAAVSPTPDVWINNGQFGRTALVRHGTKGVRFSVVLGGSRAVGAPGVVGTDQGIIELVHVLRGFEDGHKLGGAGYADG